MLVTLYDSAEAWSRSRRAPDTLGASEAAAALGVHPNLTAWSLWNRKRGGEQQHDAATRAVLARGHRWESAVLAEYEDATGHRVTLPGTYYGGTVEAIAVVAHEATPWLRATPDAVAVDARGAVGAVEAKTAANPDRWTPDAGLVIEAWRDEYAALVPPHYAVQCYVQQWAMGAPWTDLCALVPERGWLGLRWVRLLRDEATIAQLVEALAAWREQHLVRGVPPDLDASDGCREYLVRAFRPRPGRAATVHEAALMEALADALAEERTAKVRADELRNLLLASAGGSRLTVGWGALARFGQPEVHAGRQTIDADALRTRYPEAAAACTRTGAPSGTFKLYRFSKE